MLVKNIITVARKFQGSEEFNGRDGIAWTGKVRYDLRIKFLHHLGYLALYSLVVACGLVGQTVFPVVDYCAVVSHNRLQD